LNQPEQEAVASGSRQLRLGDISALGWVIRILGIVVAIYAAAKLSAHLVVPPSSAAPVWPGAGIALAVILMYGPRALFGIFIGVVVLEFQMFDVAAGGGSLALVFGLAIGA
jgi:hypothetical protein